MKVNLGPTRNLCAPEKYDIATVHADDSDSEALMPFQQRHAVYTRVFNSRDGDCCKTPRV